MQGQPATTAVDAATPYSSQPISGRKLTRAQALGHPRRTEFWDVADFILLNDPDVKGIAQDALDDIGVFIGRP